MTMFLAGVALVGLGTASAARLDLGPAGLGTGSAATASCQGGSPFAATLVSAPSGPGSTVFATSAVVLQGVHGDCGGRTYRVSVVTTDGTQLGEAVGLVPAGGGTFTTTGFAPVATSQVARVEVVIHS